MSNNRAAKGSGSNTFETYRQIAPESLDDQALRNIIKDNKNDHTAISLAIQNIWQDIPDQKAVGTEWVTTSKPRKDAAPVKSSSARRNDTAGGRGAGGRGRGLAPAGGRGAGDGRGDRASRPAAARVGANARTTPSPTVTQAADEAAEEEVEVVEVEVVAPVAVAAPTHVSAGIASSGPVVWGQGGSLADRLKRAEADKAKAEAEAKAPKEVAVAAPAAAAPAAQTDAAAGDAKGRPRGPRRARGGSASGKRGEDSAVGDLTEAVAESLAVAPAEEVEAPKVEEVVPPPPPLVQVSAAPVEAAPALAPAAEQEFLKMGKWGANGESAEMGSFQFGSFGNAYDDSANNGVSASQVGTNPAAAPWTGLHTSDDKAVSSSVWGAPAEPSLDMSAGLFAQQSAAASSSAADLTTSNAAASRAPPGLAPKNNKPVGQSKPKTEAPQQQAQTQVPAQANAAYNQGYNQPPGMNRNVGGLNALPNAGLQYGYNPSFDLSQQAQFGGYPLAGAVAPQVPAAGAAATTTPATSAQGAAATAAAPNAALAQAQQPYAQAAPFQFFNPYYPGQYYYGQPQMANFYNQGRDMYQQRGPYGANPYGGAGSLYPGDVYGQQVAGQFPDASGNYGMGLVHPGMQGQGAGNASGNAGNNAAAGNNNNAKGAKGNNPVGAAPAQGMTPDQHTANLLMNSGYGYVNPYGGRGGMEAQGWQGYPGAGAQGWGAPMMGFPSNVNASPTNVNGANTGFAQQAGAPQQQQGQAQQGQGQQQGNRAGGNNGYGNNNSFGGRGSGAAPTAGGVPSQGSW